MVNSRHGVVNAALYVRMQQHHPGELEHNTYVTFSHHNKKMERSKRASDRISHNVFLISTCSDCSRSSTRIGLVFKSSICVIVAYILLDFYTI